MPDRSSFSPEMSCPAFSASPDAISHRPSVHRCCCTNASHEKLSLAFTKRPFDNAETRVQKVSSGAQLVLMPGD